MEIDNEYYDIAEERIFKAHSGDKDIHYDVKAAGHTSVDAFNVKVEVSDGKLKTEQVQ
jgi:osmotically-inducible protein OsmY